MPLEFLRLGQFDGPPENRKEKVEEGGLLDSLRSNTRPQYPFTIYHASAKLNRRYTFYTNTEAARAKWLKLLKEAMAIHSIRQDANQVGFWLEHVDFVICLPRLTYRDSVVRT